jgi:hypothetical protein
MLFKMSPITTTQKRVEEHATVLQKVQTAMLTLSTALVIGCFSFLWNINATMSAQKVMIDNNKENISKLDDRVRFLENTAADQADRLTKVELSTSKR